MRHFKINFLASKWCVHQKVERTSYKTKHLEAFLKKVWIFQYWKCNRNHSCCFRNKIKFLNLFWNNTAILNSAHFVGVRSGIQSSEITADCRCRGSYPLQVLKKKRCISITQGSDVIKKYCNFPFFMKGFMEVLIYFNYLPNFLHLIVK